METMFTLEIIGIFAAYILLFLGVWREAWSSKKKTFTTLGWFLAFIGAIPLVISIGQINQKEKEINKLNQEIRQVEISSYESLHDALHDRLFPSMYCVNIRLVLII